MQTSTGAATNDDNSSITHSLGVVGAGEIVEEEEYGAMRKINGFQFSGQDLC